MFAQARKTTTKSNSIQYRNINQLSRNIREANDNQEFAAALAEACPALIGKVIRDDCSGLQEGYVLNRNGLAFLQGDALDVGDGDSLLILSNQAGG